MEKNIFKIESIEKKTEIQLILKRLVWIDFNLIVHHDKCIIYVRS